MDVVLSEPLPSFSGAPLLLSLFSFYSQLIVLQVPASTFVWVCLTSALLTVEHTSFGRITLPNESQLSKRTKEEKRRACVGTASRKKLTSAIVSPAMQYPVHNDTDTDAILLMSPGSILHYDYRSSSPVPQGSDATANLSSPPKLGNTLRVAQWNIERGVELNAIIATLKALHADIIICQELDINCRRSGYVNVPKEIAKALEAEVYFVCEFEELDSAVRSPHNAVGELSQPSQATKATASPPRRHFHGNATFSLRATMTEPAVIRHRTTVNWEVDGNKFSEPRHGFRSALRVSIAPSERGEPKTPTLYIYNCHFEVFCGGLTRVRQLADCTADMKRLVKYSYDPMNPRNYYPAFLLGGDLNTMAHGIVRLSPKYATDRLRFLSIGETEACWLQRNILSRDSFLHMSYMWLPFSPRFLRSYMKRFLYLQWYRQWIWRLLYGLSFAEQHQINNWFLCLYDPGDKLTSITLNNPHYRGYVQGKLDWLLLSNLEPQPFQQSGGATQPVDSVALLKLGSISASSPTAKYLASLDTNAKEEIAADVNSHHAGNVPDDGYLLFNEAYTASDHRGLLITVSQHCGDPKDVYQYVYTSSWAATGILVAVRVLLFTVAVMPIYKGVAMVCSR